MRTVPVWAAIVIGLGSGLAGSMIGTLLTISHERAAEFRSRMLSAAEDLLRAGEAVRGFARHPQGTATADPLKVLQAAWDDLVSAVGLVQLLFGPESEAVHWARETANELSDVEKELRAALDTDSDFAGSIEDHMLAAGGAMEKFGVAAVTRIRTHRR